MEYSFQNKKGITLVEILIVMGIISILFASFFYIWNTMDIFRKSRDSKRINDLQLLDTALKTLLFTERNINLGEENVIYTSLPDSSSTCGSYNLLPLFSPYSYRCQTSQNYLKVDGNGWLPVNFTLGKILTISVLPIDPLNNKDYFYAYQVRQGRYKLTARFETKTNISKMANDGGFEPTLYEVGSDLFIPSPHSGLVGYWSFDEGTGTIAYDLSGYGNNGTLNNFNFNETSGWTTGKIGSALNFDGVDDYSRISDSNSLDVSSSFTFSVWVYTTNSGILQTILSKDGVGSDTTGAYNLYIRSDLSVFYETNNINGVYTTANVVSLNRWYYITVTFDNNISPKLKIYVNGQKLQEGNPSAPYILTTDLLIGRRGIDSFFQGLIDEVRIYNRALSDSEIKVLYDATK
jgi:prepilin-type N-terminal cleavage/methylation domain-containing protein